MGTEEDTLEQAAASRAERLRALKAAALEAAPDRANNEDDDTAEQEEDVPNTKFRNYVPQDKELNGVRVEPREIPKFEDPVASAPPPTDKTEAFQDPFLNIAPKKPNWDLRRDVQKKLDRRTHKALFKVMEQQEKEKLRSEEGEDVAEEYVRPLPNNMIQNIPFLVPRRHKNCILVSR